MSRQTRQFGSRWFRVYDEAADDPKLLMLSDKLHRFLFNCWCLASKHEGYLPPVPEIACRVRKPETVVSAMIAELHERGLLDDEADTFTPHNWGLRQYKSDVSTPRVKAFRERRRNGNETFPKQDETVSETPPEQSRTEQKQNRAETECVLGPPLQSRPSPRWMLDEQYAAFVKDYQGTGGAFIDADFAEAYEFRWRALDFEQKLQRIAALNRHAEEYRSEPRFVPKPLKFLESEWERPVRPPAQNGKRRSVVENITRQIEESLAKGESPW